MSHVYVEGSIYPYEYQSKCLSQFLFLLAAIISHNSYSEHCTWTYVSGVLYEEVDSRNTLWKNETVTK